MGAAYLQRYGKGTQGTGWYSFDKKGVHFVGLVNVMNLKAGGLGSLGAEQLEWLEKDVKQLSKSTPVVVFAHIPLWAVYPEWGWGTEDSAQALGYLKRFGSVRKAASYAGKYVSKSIEEGAVPARRHRYLRAAGLGEPVPTVTYHDSWLSAIEDYRHPMWWSAFFDGREIDRPFLYISFDPPEP